MEPDIPRSDHRKEGEEASRRMDEWIVLKMMSGWCAKRGIQCQLNINIE